MASPDEPLDGIESRFVHAVDETEWVPLSLTLVEYPQGRYERLSAETDCSARVTLATWTRC